jgi:hypothetical protein
MNRQDTLVGTYKLVSLVLEVDGKPNDTMGKAPHGYLVVTPKHWLFFITAENRKFGNSVAEKAALFDSLVGYGGTYRIEGDQVINDYDVSFIENLNGKSLPQRWQLSGNRLTLTEGPTSFPRDPSKQLIRRMVLEKVE